MNKFKVVLKKVNSFRDGKTLLVEADTCVGSIKQVIKDEGCSLSAVKRVSNCKQHIDSQ